MSVKVKYGARYTADTTRDPSPNLWRDAPDMDALGMTSSYRFIRDDFYSGGSAISTNTFSWTGGSGSSGAVQYQGFGTTGVTMNVQAGGAGAETGHLQLDVDADDEEAYLSLDTTYAEALFEPTDTAGDVRDLWIESRMKWDNVDAGAAAIGKAFGLADVDAVATGFFGADAAALYSGEFIGFRALAADGDGLDCVYSDGTEVVFEEAADNTALNAVADTYIKLGMRFRAATKKLEYYVNGVHINTNPTAVGPGTTNFPDAVGLVPIWGIRQHGTGDFEMTIDWWQALVGTGT